MIVLLYLISIAAALHQGYLERIKRDLNLFSGGVTEEMMKRASNHHRICVLTISNRRLVEPDCFVYPAHLKIFREVASELPDMRFAINNYDVPRVPKKNCEEGADWKTCGCDADYQPDMSHGFFQGPYDNAPIF